MPPYHNRYPTQPWIPIPTGDTTIQTRTHTLDRCCKYTLNMNIEKRPLPPAIGTESTEDGLQVTLFELVCKRNVCNSGETDFFSHRKRGGGDYFKIRKIGGPCSDCKPCAYIMDGPSDLYTRGLWPYDAILECKKGNMNKPMGYGLTQHYQYNFRATALAHVMRIFMEVDIPEECPIPGCGTVDGTGCWPEGNTLPPSNWRDLDCCNG
jgi:hypothetical protein